MVLFNCTENEIRDFNEKTAFEIKRSADLSKDKFLDDYSSKNSSRLFFVYDSEKKSALVLPKVINNSHISGSLRCNIKENEGFSGDDINQNASFKCDMKKNERFFNQGSSNREAGVNHKQPRDHGLKTGPKKIFLDRFCNTEELEHKRSNKPEVKQENSVSRSESPSSGADSTNKNFSNPQATCLKRCASNSDDECENRESLFSEIFCNPLNTFGCRKTLNKDKRRKSH